MMVPFINVLKLINYLNYSDNDSLITAVKTFVLQKKQSCIIRQFPLDDDSLDNFAKQFGQPLIEKRNKDEGAIGYVEVKEQHIPIYANTPHEFPCHTDCADFPDPPDMVFLLCVTPASRGGESLLVELSSFIDLFSEKERRLLSEPNFNFNQERFSIFESTSSETRVRYNRVMLEITRRLSNQPEDESFQLLNRFDQLIVNHQKEISLNSGDCLVLNNHLMLHGRNQFHCENRLLKRVRVKSVPSIVY